MQRQTPKRNRWTSLSAMMMIAMLGSSVGCVSIKHYVRHHSVVANVAQKHQSDYFHCSHCGQIMPKEGFSKCPRCFQIPAYHGYEPTCWRQWPEGWGCTPESVINNPEFWAEGMLESNLSGEESATEAEDPPSQSDLVDPPQENDDIPLPAPEQVNVAPEREGIAGFQQEAINEVPHNEARQNEPRYGEARQNEPRQNGGFTQLTPAQSAAPTFFEPSVSEVATSDQIDNSTPAVESFTPPPVQAVPKAELVIEYDDPPAPVQAVPAKPAPVEAAPVKPSQETVSAMTKKTVAEPVKVVETAKKTTAEPVKVVEKAKKTVATPPQETVTAPVPKPVSEPVTKTVTPPAAKTVSEPAKQTVIEPVKEIAPRKETVDEAAKNFDELTKKNVTPTIRDVRTDLFGNPVEAEATPLFEQQPESEDIQSPPAKEIDQSEPSPLFEFRRQAVNTTPTKRVVTKTERETAGTPSSTFKPVNRIPLPRSVKTLDQPTGKSTSNTGNQSAPVEYKINDLQVSTKPSSPRPASILMQPTAADRRTIRVPSRPASVLSTANVNPQLSPVSILRQTDDRDATASPSTSGRPTMGQAARAEYAPIPVRRIQPPRNVQTSASIGGGYHPAPVSRIPLNALPLKVTD